MEALPQLLHPLLMHLADGNRTHNSSCECGRLTACRALMEEVPSA
jgi:hypothetical protein